MFQCFHPGEVVDSDSRKNQMRYKFTLDFVIQVATLEVIWFSEAKTLNNTVSLVFSSEKMDFNHNFFFIIWKFLT